MSMNQAGPINFLNQVLQRCEPEAYDIVEYQKFYCTIIVSMIFAYVKHF